MAVNKPKKKDELNLRERKFVKALLEGISITEALRRAGYSESFARSAQGKMLARVKPTLDELMEEEGLTDKRLIQSLKEGLFATKVISANVIAKDGEGMADANSMTRDFVDVEDYPTRHKYLDTALKLKDKYPSDKLEHSGEVTVKGTIKFVK